MLNEKKFRSILCLNGELPSKTFFHKNLPIIAADGAFLKLRAMNISPQMVIGDFDSVDQALLKDFPHQYNPDQSSSDFQKCLVYMQAEDLLPAIIVGINGGFIDHVLHNINIFTQTESIFFAPPILGFTIISPHTHHVKTTVGSKISLIGLPSARVETRGLKWELDNVDLNFPGNNSCFNRVSQTALDITVHSGCLLVLQYEQPILDAGWLENL